MPAEPFLSVTSPKEGVHVVSFTTSDVREKLYDTDDIIDSALFAEFKESVVANLKADETVVLNFGKIEPFPTAFYRWMLSVRQAVRAENAELRLCEFTPLVKECFELMGGSKIFNIHDTQVDALRAANEE